MEHASEDAPLASETRTESQEVLVQPTGAPGASNSRALKIAGLTTLACLLLSAQVFTAYMVFDQRQQIQGLQTINQKMEKQMSTSTRSRVPPKPMVMPIGSLPLVDFTDDGKSPQPPKVEPLKQNASPPTVEEQLRELMKDQQLPQMNQSFLANLQTLKDQVPDSDWKSFESWLRYWLIFQSAQKTPAPTPKPGAFIN